MGEQFQPSDRIVVKNTGTHGLIVWADYARLGSPKARIEYIDCTVTLKCSQLRLWTPADGEWKGPEV